MKLSQIETADMKILDILINHRTIKIFFSEIYDLCQKKYIKNVGLFFNNCEEFHYEQFDNNSKIFNIININKLISFSELFESIQLITEDTENGITLEGFHKEGFWARLIIRCSDYDIIKNINLT